MPRSRSNNHHHNNSNTNTNSTATTSSSSSTATITIAPAVLHLPQQHQQTSSSSSPPPNLYHHNTSYGLLEPTQPKVSRPPIHHRRKSSSSNSSASWGEKGFDLADLKDRGVGLGEKLEKLPGVRYSATFISSLRTNLALSASLAPLSPSLQSLSPSLLPRRTSSLALPSSSMVISKDTDPLADVPELSFFTPKTKEDKTSGLKLVADIYSQHRSTASTALIYNPFSVALWIGLVSLLYPWVYRDPTRDKPNLAISIVGMLMFVLAGVRHIVRPYESLTEKINWEWVGDDEMLIAKFGTVVIGTLVYRADSTANGDTAVGQGKKSHSNRRLLIRAWTVRPRERGRGIGRGLLEKLVDIARQKGFTAVEFAPVQDQAGSERVLKYFDRLGLPFVKNWNKEFDNDAIRAKGALQHVLEERWVEKRRRGSR